MRLASQVPAISKKFRTFAGLTMPEMARPAPKIIPDTSAITICMAVSQKMPGYEHNEKGNRHENAGRCERAGREAGQAADTMTAGATAADRCSRADYQSGNRRNEAGCWKLDRAGVIDAGDGGK